MVLMIRTSQDEDGLKELEWSSTMEWSFSIKRGCDARSVNQSR